MYIYENKCWPKFKWDSEILLPRLSAARNYQGKIVGKMGALGFELKNQANFEILTLDVLKSNEIEGELLDREQVRSSLARRLGIKMSGLMDSDRYVDGVVDMMLDATGNYYKRLDKKRLFSWHSGLFPTGYSGFHKIIVANWRDDSNGPMQVISGAVGKEKVHFQAPSARNLENEMSVFFNWINGEQNIDPVLKAGIAHLWFVTLHPFEDGNGRIARAIADMILARSDEQPYRFYSMSTQIRKERKEYYEILEKTQKGTIDITGWLKWFLNCLLNSLEASEVILKKVIFKHNFLLDNNSKISNERQRKMLYMLLDGFDGKLTTSKWSKICKCSQDTALRDIQDLINNNVLYKLPDGGRSTGYAIVTNEPD
jgi:Fic family protein